MGAFLKQTNPQYMEFIKLQDQLPPAQTLVLVNRTSGLNYLAFRQDIELSTDPDPSRNCYWRGSHIDDLEVKNIEGGFATCSFSDVTVNGWKHIS